MIPTTPIPTTPISTPWNPSTRYPNRARFWPLLVFPMALALVALLWAPLSAAASADEEAAGAELSVKSVLDMAEVKSFVGEAGLGRLHANAPPELAQFGRLVGIWHGKTEMRAQNGEWLPGADAVWVFKYALGGFAIQDLWIHPEDHLPVYMAGLGRPYLLTSLRVYQPAKGTWSSAWASNSAGRGGGMDFGVLEARAEAEDMVLTGQSEFGHQRVTFSEISDEGFLWTSEYSRDGEQWTAFMRVRAERHP